ncbi:MAG: 2-oxoacid:acceptor oxidoreductase family protein [Deltaproteobacteria bacterium]|nr:2-oxoacid:acceptor oxidoreductase family protein [Deltaproteobacteria bacterium]
MARKLAEALAKVDIEPARVVLTSDIGCVGLVDPHFPTAHTVHAIHGRSTAIAAGALLADGILYGGGLENVVMIGDGGATIGLLHLSQAALMNVDLTVLLHNNMLYGMTGGQHSAFTPEGFHTSTTPEGNWVPAIDMAEFVRSNHGGFYARILATDPKLSEVIALAIEHPGFAIVEILELCTGFAVPMNHLDGKSLKAMADAHDQALGVLIQRTDREPYHVVYRKKFPAPASTEPKMPAGPPSPDPARFTSPCDRQLTVVLAGSAGERVQSSAAILSQAAVLSGLHVVQKNDYPVTVGSGFSLAEVKLGPEKILFTGTESVDALLVVSADGLKEVRGRGDLSRLARGGAVIADSSVGHALGVSESYELRKVFGGDNAALGALCVWLRRSGALELDALVAAAAALGIGSPGSVARVIEESAELIEVADQSP